MSSSNTKIGSGHSRRNFFYGLGSALAIPALTAACGKDKSLLLQADSPTTSSAGNGTYVPVVTPGIKTLPFEMDGDVKVFRLTAEPVTIQFPDMSEGMGMTNRPIDAWGYNGSVIGPTIECVEGDTVRIIFTNNLPEPSTVHWHGLHVPIGMDGVPGISQKPVAAGDTFTYEFKLNQHGTYFYHPHFSGAKQAGMGMSGFFIIHPRNPEPWMIVDRDYAYFLQTWMIQPGTRVPDVLEMTEMNYFTMNGRPGPNIVPMQANVGEKVRIRVINLSMMTHPIHLHGHTYRITEHGAGFIPPSMQIPANTENLSAAEERSFEFVAGPNLGKWLFHCHFMHHVMNDMHRNPLPGGGGHEGMMHDGGMHTWIEVK